LELISVDYTTVTVVGAGRGDVCDITTEWGFFRSLQQNVMRMKGVNFHVTLFMDDPGRENCILVSSFRLKKMAVLENQQQ